MPLDPFFADRLQRQRSHMIRQALEGVKRRVGWPWFMRPVAVAEASAATPAARGEARAQARAEVRDRVRQDKPHASVRRAEHRRIALSWDREELRKVGTPGPAVHVVEHTVTVRGYPDVRVRLYYPDEHPPSPDERLPAFLVFFGGAFRIGGIDYPTTDAAHRRRAQAARVVMAAVDYALAPEYKYPAAVEQGHAALEWLFAHAADLGIDGERIGVAGTSAGGNIAAAVALMNRDRGGLPVRLQVLEVPVVDLTGRHIDLSATRRLGIPSLIVARELASVARTYLRHRRDAREPYASPLRAASLERLPPAVVFTAQYDPLRGDGAAYAAALREAGVEASAVQYLGVTHDISIFTRALAAARRWEADVVAALRSLHAA